MNKHCYRMVFNKARGILMAVAEIAVSQGKASGETSGKSVVPGAVRGSAFRAQTFSAWATLTVNVAGLVMWTAPAIGQAQIVADPSAPASQRPTILTAPNGLPLVNIQTPSVAGVSRNTYRQFDVQQQGAILNNSRTNVQTQLGGWVQGNPWLATGSARVILNEVNSSNPSLLQGYVEVAGSRAQVVIANPAGVTCDGCGFINASRATVTTGTPILTGGNLEGYRVQGGAINIIGAGLDTSTADYTDLIARSVQVNAGIWANQLKVTAGANQIDAEHTAATPIAGTGAAPAFAIDVAQLGGMYAGKITLVGTETGVGVRNAGNIGASVGEVIVTAEGRLENSGSIISINHMQIDTHSGIQNSGTIVSIGTATLNAIGDLDNQGGQIQVVGEANIALGGTLNNTASLVRSGQSLSIAAGDIVNADTQGDNQGLEGLSVRLNAQQIDNQQGVVRADDTLVVTSGNSIDNTQGVISSGNSVRLQDAILADKTLAITNTGGTVIAGQQLNVDSASLTGDGKVLSLGDLSLKLTQNYTHSGELQANTTASLETAGTFTNQSTLRAGTALNLRAASIDNQTSGQISANQVNLKATDNQTLTNRGLIEGQDTIVEATTLNNLGTGRIYGDHIAIGATTVTNDAENGVAPVIGARNRLDIGAQTITNREHALLFSAGDLAIGGSLDTNNQAIGQAATLNNNSATIEALDSVDLAVRQINNTNEHFSTTVQSLGTEYIVEYQGSGSPNRYTPGTPGVYIYNDESDQLHTPEGNYESWLSYNYNRSITETKVQSSDPAQILSGTDMRISADTLLNDKSEIIAGGGLTGVIATLNNTEVAGRRTIADSGTVTSFWRDNQKGRDSTGSSIAGYNPATVIQAISLTPTVYRQNTAPTGTGTQIATLYASSANQAPSGAHAVSVPNNSLFRLNSSPTSGYLVETDARFANYRNWLSSDYLLNALSIDPVTTQKRLGDGFYEQKLIREQVAQLTGRRFLDGYANDEAQYQALMGNASIFAQTYQLRPGVALSAEQMAQLTSDIVWLVEKEIILPDGQMTKALVPQLYVAVKDGDLQASGALITGNNVNLNLSSDLNNSGTIAGRNVVALTAENVRNLGGRITGNDVGVAASNDLNNIGGTIDAANSLTATAGRDLNVISTTSTQTNAQGSRTNINRVAGLYVTGSSGTLLAAAGRDINFDSATILNAGPPATGQSAGSTMIAAGNNLNLGTVTESSSNSIVWDGKNYRKDSSRTDVGSTIQTQGEIRLQAANDLNAKAANVSSDQGMLLATAGGNVNLIAGEATRSLDEAHQHTSKGFLSSKTTTTRDTLSETTAQASTLSGNATTVLANQDINVKGSNVVGTNDVTLTALNNVKIEAATNTLQESHFREEKKSGLLSSGGIGFTIGSQQQSTDNKGVSAMANSSTVGSTAGNVTIAAGNDYRQVGSNVVAPQGDIDINAKKIDIIESQNTSLNTTETKFKQSGITLALSSPVISAVQTAQHMAEAAGETKDARMQALAGATVALNAKSSYGAVKAGQGQTINGKDNQIVTGRDANGNVTGTRDANAADKVGGINVSISVGSSKSQSNSTQTSSTAQGSTVAAGNNVNLTATGAGKDSDLTVQGSQITAGNNATLKADDQINLLAAQSTSEQHSTNKSSSGSVGISYGSDGLLLSVGASGGRGKADGSDVTQANTHVEAGNTLALQSGNDTTLKGAVASGKQVVADVGGNLNIESLQDTSQYDSKQKSMGGSISVGYGKMSGSFNSSKSNANSNYASVVEQSGIKAGDEGFQVNVNGNTDLQGAVIASTDKAVLDGKNSLTTATLTTSDIQNRAEYSVSSSSIGASLSYNPSQSVTQNVADNLLGNASRAIVPGLEESGNQNSVTRSAIAQGAVNITSTDGQQNLTGQSAAQTIANLNRDTSSAHAGALARTPDVEEIKQQQAATMEIVSTAAPLLAQTINKIYDQRIADYNRQYDDTISAARAKEAQAKALEENGKPDEAKQLSDQAQSLRAQAIDLRNERDAPTLSRELAQTLGTVLIGGLATGQVDLGQAAASYTVGTVGDSFVLNAQRRDHDKAQGVAVTCKGTPPECAQAASRVASLNDAKVPLEARLKALEDTGQFAIKIVDGNSNNLTNVAINGINNEPDRALVLAVGELRDGEKRNQTLYLSYNDAQGGVTDVINVAIDKFTGAESNVSRLLGEAFMQAGADATLYAHSGGTAVSNVMLNALADNGYANANIRVDYFGPAVTMSSSVQAVLRAAGLENATAEQQANWLKFGNVNGQSNEGKVDSSAGPGMGYLNKPNDTVATFVGFNLGQGNAYNQLDAASKLEGATIGSILQSIMEMPALLATPTSAHSVYRWNNPATWPGYQSVENKETP